MPPKYPFTRSHPSSSSTTTTTTEDRPIVVSASGVAPKSPAAGLSADSPSTLRSRIPSPRNPFASNGFTNDTSSYPSPSSELSKGKSKGLSLVRKKKNKSEGGGKGWMRVDTESPTKGSSNDAYNNIGSSSHAGTIAVPKYDSRGYPIREQPIDPKLSPESSRSIRFTDPPLYSTTIHPNRSQESLNSISSTSAGVSYNNYPPHPRDPSDSRFLSPERPTSYYAPIDGASPNTLYPPTMNYGLNQPSYSPYETNPERMVDPGVVPNGYSNGWGGDSRVSLNSLASESSMTQFKKYDALRGGPSNFSISSKGGKRQLGDMFSLPADPASWSYLGPEEDDDFHDPDVKPSRQTHFWRSLMTVRGASNLGCLVILLLMLVTLFAGYPIASEYLAKAPTTNGAYNLGGVNATGQAPDIGPFQLIDKDTPASAYTWTSLETGDQWELIFSDEFNNDGRTFYDGDDPYWQAEDLHYWATNNLEWYDPRAITTRNGSLEVTLSNIETHGLNYQGGMMTTWNRFCFTGGYVEASVSLPGKSNVYGLWPAVWAMGNLGRAGYGGTLDGMWPYSYDSCDVGTLPNQTLNGLPAISTTSGPEQYNYSLSYLPGQRLSRCTCSGDTTHPGPVFSNGTFKGRAAPEIDMLEAVVNSDTLKGEVSQSGQFAPFNPNYYFINNSKTYEVYDSDETWINTYQGGVYQQATSGLSYTDQNCYTGETGCHSIYGFEYTPGTADGYITWVNNAKKAWTIRAPAMGPNAQAGVGQRLISEEPMYLIINLGISENFGAVDYDGLESLWPVTMEVDYIRVYQDPNARNIGCDPPGMPTAAYIAHYPDAYSNPNITVFEHVANFAQPKNSLVDTC